MSLNPYEIIYMDNHILVAVKAPGILSQGDHTGDADILSLLKQHVKTAFQKPGEAYLGLIHRLDRPVGGLMVFARGSKAAARLSQQMRNGDIHRSYLVVLAGVLTERLTLTDYLLKDKRNKTVTAVPEDTPGAKRAVMHCKPLAVQNGRTLAEAELETGRSHQIRVQLSRRGYPVINDTKYGNRGNNYGSIGLYAYRLSFNHPTLGNRLTFRHIPRHGAFAAFVDHGALTELGSLSDEKDEGLHA